MLTTTGMSGLLGHINHNNQNACQPGLGASGANLSWPGRLVLSFLTGAGNRQMVNVRQGNTAWTCKDAAHDSHSTPCVQKLPVKHVETVLPHDYAVWSALCCDISDTGRKHKITM